MNRPTYQLALLEATAYRRIRSLVSGVLEPYKINTSQWIIMGLTNERPKKLRISDVARILRVEDPLITNQVHDLINKKLVGVFPHRQDKRARVLALTPKGRKLIDKIEPELAKALASVEACASPADWETYFAVLGQIINATDKD